MFDHLIDKKDIEIILEAYQLERIPAEIKMLKNAESLKISLTKTSPQWSVRPPLSWFETRELKEPYRLLPDEISQLKNLRTLSLTNLDLIELPYSLQKLDKLTYLNLSFNKLDISKELSLLKSLPSLKTLHIYGNHFNKSEIQEWENLQSDLSIKYAGKN